VWKSLGGGPGGVVVGVSELDCVCGRELVVCACRGPERVRVCYLLRTVEAVIGCARVRRRGGSAKWESNLFASRVTFTFTFTILHVNAPLD
jgi:hypothetical protein